MLTIKDKIEAGKKAGKLEKITIYCEIIEIAYNERNSEIYHYFQKLKTYFEEYLVFDSNPPDSIKAQFSYSMLLIFSFMKNSAQIELFDEYYKIYNKFNRLINDLVIKAKLYQKFGYFFWQKNEIDKSLNFLIESLNMITESSVIYEIPERYTNLGYVYEYLGQLDKAEDYYRQGLKFAQRNNYDEALILAYSGFGRLNLRLKRFRLAINYLEENLKLINEEDNNLEVATITTNIAMAYLNLNQAEKALELNKSLEQDWVREIDQDLYYTIICNIGSCYYNLQELDKAQAYFSKALDYAHKQNDIPLKICSKINLSYIAYSKGKYEEAVKYLTKILLLIESSDNIRQNMEVYNLLAKTFFDSKNYEQALENLIITDSLARQVKDLQIQAEVNYYMALCYNKQKDYRKAYKFLLKSYNTEKKWQASVDKPESEVMSRKVIDSGSQHHYLYLESVSPISQSLNAKIGSPIIGKSKQIHDIIEKALIAAKNPSLNVMILGESGTGKELIARLIHYAGEREKAPFVDVNSSVFTLGLAESALFGHKKGAFTGAFENHKGYFEAANKGTIFFDEIAEMPLEIQAMILRVLETKEIKALGSHQTIKVDFRLICASNINMHQSINEKKFRFDLYNRLNTIEIHIPPLRERKSDLPLLIDYYLTILSEKMEIEKPEVSLAALNKLTSYDYPGNIRELINVIQKILLFSKKNIIDIDDILIPEMNKSELMNEERDLSLQKNEILLINRAMEKTNNVMARASLLLDISPFALARKIKKYNLSFLSK